jgi:hypothetical protein
MLKLPKQPKTRGQLCFVRHWLRQLAQAHFEIGEYWDDVFNPEFIGMFPPTDERRQEEKENFSLSFETFKVKKD